MAHPPADGLNFPDYGERGTGSFSNLAGEVTRELFDFETFTMETEEPPKFEKAKIGGARNIIRSIGRLKSSKEMEESLGLDGLPGRREEAKATIKKSRHSVHLMRTGWLAMILGHDYGG
jgi:hypothetical protein